MRKLITGLAVFILAATIAYCVVPTRFPGGLSTMTPAQQQTNSVTPADGDVAVQGDLTVIGTSAFTGAMSLDDLTLSGIISQTVQTEGPIIWTSSDVAITPTSSFIVLHTTYQAILFTSLPMFTTSAFSEPTWLWVTASSTSVTIYDNGTVAGSLIELTEGTSVTLAKGDLLTLRLSNGSWHQAAPVQHVSGAINTVGNISVGGTATISGAATVRGDLTTSDDIIAKGVSLTTGTASGLITANGGVTANADITANDDIVAKGIKLSTAIASGLITANGGVTANADLTVNDDIIAAGVSMSTAIASGLITANGGVTSAGDITANANIAANNDIIATGVSMSTAIASGLITANGGVTVNADLTTNDDIIGQGIKGSTATFTGDITAGADVNAYRVKVSTGYVRLVDPVGNGRTHRVVVVSTNIASGVDFSLAPVSDGKAGSFVINAGTYTACGTFTTAGAVSLGIASPDVTTTDNTAAKFNVYDGGTSISIENKNEVGAIEAVIQLILIE